MEALLKLLKLPSKRILTFAAKKKLPRIEQSILRRIIASPQLAAKFYPYEGARTSYILPKVGHECPKNESDLPIPPKTSGWATVKRRKSTSRGDEIRSVR